MSFKLSAEATSAFGKIDKYSSSGKIDKWDFYYFCSIIGMSKQKLCSETVHLEEFYREYTAEYRPYKYLIAGNLITSELKRTGLLFTKENITEKFRQLISSESSLVLNSKGLNLLDRYAEGGFEILSERSPPITDSFQFITTCVRIINEDNTNDHNNIQK